MKLTHKTREHLYRCHPLPIRCRRCYEVFSSEEQLDAHSQSDQPCQRQQDVEFSEPALEGIGLSQERRLRCRKRSNKTEEEKWGEVYMICFPDAPGVPSPHHQAPGAASFQTWRTPNPPQRRRRSCLQRRQSEHLGIQWRHIYSWRRRRCCAHGPKPSAAEWAVPRSIRFIPCSNRALFAPRWRLALLVNPCRLVKINARTYMRSTTRRDIPTY